MPVMHWSAPGAGLSARHRSRSVAAGRVALDRGHDDTLSGPGRSNLADWRLPAGAAGRPLCRLQPCDCHVGRSVDGCGTRPGTTALRCDLKNFGGFRRFLGPLPGVRVSRGLRGLRGCWGCWGCVSFWGFRAWPCGAPHESGWDFAAVANLGQQGLTGYRISAASIDRRKCPTNPPAPPSWQSTVRCIECAAPGRRCAAGWRASALVDPHQRRATPIGCAVDAPLSCAALASEHRRVAPMHRMCSARAALRLGSARVDPHQRGATPGGCAIGAPPSAATLLAALGLERRRVAKAAHGSGCSVVSAERNSSARRLSSGGPNITTLT